MIKGYVYVLSNKSIKGVKCGYTDRDPQERCDELYNTSVPTPFKVEYSVFLYDARVLEKKINRRVYNLAVSGYATERELIRLEKSNLLSKIDTIIIQYCNNDYHENLASNNKKN